MEKSARIGIRISPEKKAKYTLAAEALGYSGLSAFLEATADWAVAYKTFNGDYSAYLDAKKKEQVQ